MLWGERSEKAGSRQESNPGHLWLELPVLCHCQPDNHQPLTILYICSTYRGLLKLDNAQVEQSWNETTHMKNCPPTTGIEFFNANIECTAHWRVQFTTARYRQLLVASPSKDWATVVLPPPVHSRRLFSVPVQLNSVLRWVSCLISLRDTVAPVKIK